MVTWGFLVFILSLHIDVCSDQHVCLMRLKNSRTDKPGHVEALVNLVNDIFRLTGIGKQSVCNQKITFHLHSGCPNQLPQLYVAIINCRVGKKIIF